MTAPLRPAAGGPSRSMIDEAMLLYETASGVLSQAVREARTEGEDDLKKVRQVSDYARELSRAVQVLLTERARIDAQRRFESGGVTDHALDFDAARAEIGRRLACLRTAGEGGGVP